MFDCVALCFVVMVVLGLLVVCACFVGSELLLLVCLFRFDLWISASMVCCLTSNFVFGLVFVCYFTCFRWFYVWLCCYCFSV